MSPDRAWKLTSAVILAALLATAAAQEPAPAAAGSSWQEKLKDGFTYRVEGLGYGFNRQLATGSLLNPDNIFGAPHQQVTGELRVDLQLSYDDLLLGVKPRIESTWQSWNFGPRDGKSATDTDLFVYEWIGQYRFKNQVFASYGLQNLQWGPSFLVSPSNPFIQNNGKNNPFLEVPALDYARLSWVANPTWTAQLIGNVGEGHVETLQPFRNVYAGKLDYTGVGRYGSLIVSQREGGQAQFGGYLGLTLSDALLAHLEGSVYDNGESRILAGGSYTFTDGSTVVLEYYYNGLGCGHSVTVNCFPPLGEVEPGQYLFRRNYGFVQYFNNEFIVRPLELMLRGTVDLDDGSGLLTAILNYNLNDHAELFTVLDWYTGNDDEEFGSILDSSIMVGISLTY